MSFNRIFVDVSWPFSCANAKMHI